MIKTTAAVDGMMCTMCETHINEVVRKHFQVKKVTSSHKKGSCEIISEKPIDTQELKTALAEMGYTLGEVESGPYEKRGLFGGLFG